MDTSNGSKQFGGTAYDVTVGSSGFVALDISPTINTLTLDSGAALTGSGSGPAPSLSVANGATVNGNLLLIPGLGTPPVSGPGSLFVGGDLNIGSSALVNLAGSLTVGGNLTTASPEMVLVSPSGTSQFSVSGTLTSQQGGVMLLGYSRCFGAFNSCPPPITLPLQPTNGPATSLGALVNNGQIYSWSNVTASTLVNNGTTSLIGGGASVKTLQNAGTIYLSNSCCSLGLEQTAGLTVGTGTPAVLGYNQFADGVLDEVLRGSSRYGTIVAGPWPLPGNTEGGYQVSLDGTLDIMLQNGFTPALGESFTILTTAPGDLSGTFSDVTWDAFDNGQGYFVVSYNQPAGEVVITAEAVPEPSTLLLLTPPLGFVSWRSCRRSKF